MDANEIVDIPDTPDRVCKSKKDERSESSLISCSEDLIMFSGRKDSAPQNQSEGRFIHHRRGINISEPSGNGRSTMVSSVHRHSLASENATLYRKVGNKPSKPDVRYSVNSQHADNRKDVYPKCSSTPVNHPEHHTGKCMMGGNTSRLQETSPQCVLEEGNASKLKGDLLASSSLYSSQGPSNEKHIIHPEHHMGKFMMRGNTNRLQKSSPQCLLEERNTSKSKGDLLVSSSFYSSQGPSKEKHIIHPELHMGKCMIGGNTNRLQKTSPQCVLEEGNASKSKGDLLPINSFYSSQDTSKENNVLNKGKEKINGEACKAVPSSFAMQKCLFSTKDDGDVQKLSGHTSVTVHSGTSSRAAGKKRLVRNGCISPHNVAKAKKSTESSSNCNGYIKRISPNEIAEVDPSVVFNADGEFSSSSKSKVKGKEIVSHPFSSGKHDIKMGDSTKRESGVAPLMNQNHRDTFKRHKKDRKLLSSQDRDEEILFIGSRSKPSSSGSHTQQNRRRPNALKTVIEIDEHSPTVRSSNSQSDNGLTAAAKARQVEADEMLARELQEQLYHEMPPIQDADIDSRLAWRLQQEENVQQALRSEIAVNLRVSSSPQPRRQSRSQLFQNRYRRAAPVQPPTSRLARLRASMHSHSRLLPSQMDLDARVELLEALEAVGNDDMNMVNQLINPARDFNENDYDMLLALDEHNHHHLGATSAQISNLPESIVQTSTGDSCSICLEEPEIGETIRHLPCLHKFHKDCIDSWLRRKRSCPVCKCDVT